MITTQKDGTIVISGWEQGIADSPHLGIADIRNVNLLSSPGEASVNFKTAAMNQPPTVAAVAFTVETTDILTVASTSGWYNGMAVTLNSLVDGTGLAINRVYWVGNLSGSTFKLYKNPSRVAGQLVDVTLAGSGTLSSYTLSAPLDKAIDYQGGGNSGRIYEFILDDAGRVWWIDNTGGTATNNLIYLGNDTLTGTTGRGIAIFKRHIIVFRTTTMDALDTASIEGNFDLDAAYASGGWVYGWESISTVSQTRRPSIVGQDDILYYGNSKRVASISEVTGSTFNPTSGATYNENTSALDLPAGDDVQSLGELGVYLLAGGVQNFVYPWDRVSPSFDFPLILPETKTERIVSANQIAFLLVGNRGRIYVTNGSSIELYKKLPDYITGVYEPYFMWSDAMSWKNQLYFSFTATKNDTTALTATGGIWAIDTTSGALRCTNQLSYASYAGSATVLLPHLLSAAPPGNGIYAGWSVNSTYGVDVSSTSPYSNLEARIDTEIIPLGTNEYPFTPNEFEFKLSRPMVSGESIKLSYRKNLTASFAEIGSTSTAVLSANSDTNFEDAEWVQLRVEMSSTASTPSYVPLTEIRLSGTP